MVSLREKGVDLNSRVILPASTPYVSLREKGVDLNRRREAVKVVDVKSPFVRREWI